MSEQVATLVKRDSPEAHRRRFRIRTTTPMILDLHSSQGQNNRGSPFQVLIESLMVRLHALQDSVPLSYR